MTSATAGGCTRCNGKQKGPIDVAERVQGKPGEECYHIINEMRCQEGGKDNESYYRVVGISRWLVGSEAQGKV